MLAAATGGHQAEDKRKLSGWGWENVPGILEAVSASALGQCFQGGKV